MGKRSLSQRERCGVGAVPTVYSHHEEHGGDDQPWVSGIAKQRSQEGRQVQVDGLHDHVKHLALPTKRVFAISDCSVKY